MAFRSPATGLEYRAGRFAIHGGYYVTILKTGEQAKGENTNFARAGASFYLRPAGWTPYVSPSVVLSLDDDWDNGILTELGLRIPVVSRAGLRGGVGVLRTFDVRQESTPRSVSTSSSGSANSLTTHGQNALLARKEHNDCTQQ